MILTFDPTVPGVYEDYGYKPPLVACQRLAQVVQYTHTNQFAFFRDWINFWAQNDANVRLDPDDGTTLRWYYAYYLPLGAYMINGSGVYLDKPHLRNMAAPFAPWPDDAGMDEWFYEPDNPPLFAGETGNEEPS